MITTSLRLPGEVVDRLRAEAAEQGIRYTSLIREVLVAHVMEPEPSSRALASRLDGLEREYDRRLRRLEDAQRHIAEIASDDTAQYRTTPPDGKAHELPGSIDQ
jgi:predicted DNA-binding protein